MKIKNILFSVIVVLFTANASAALISVGQWHNTNDAAGGLKENRFISNLFLAVSTSNFYTNQNEYEMLEGYRWATTSDFVNNAPTPDVYGQVQFKYNYYNEAGWQGYNFEGIIRYYFLFSDSQSTNTIMHAGTQDYRLYNINLNYSSLNQFAGFVLIKDDSLLTPETPVTSEVNEPTGLVMLASGLFGLALFRRKKASK